MAQEKFTIESLAAYLHFAPRQVERLANRGVLPGQKIGGRWQFNPEEIHHWLEKKIGLSDEEGLVEMEEVLSNFLPTDEPLEICIADILPVEAIAVPLNARTRGSVIRQMTKLAAQTGWLWDSDKMAEAVLSREEMHPTALDNGVALLHPRRPMPRILGQGFLALGQTPSGIHFGGGGNSLTDIFFLLCTYSDQNHLRVLARLSRLITLPGFLDSIRDATDASTIHQIITEAEANLS